MKTPKYISYTIIFSSIFWIVLFFNRFFLLQNPDELTGFVAKLVYIPHLVTVFLAFKIYNSAGSINKKNLLWFVITSTSLLFNDMSWYFISYYHHTTIHISPIPFLVNLIPFSLWVFSIIIFSGKILKQYVLQIKRRVKTLSIIFLVNVAIILLFLSAIHYPPEDFSLFIVSQVYTFIVQVIVFDFVMLCLIYTESKGLSIFLSGIVVLVAGDFFIVTSVLSQTSILYAYGVLLWFLGLLLNMFGSLVIYNQADYNVKNWVRKDYTIKSKLTFWCFSGGIASFLLFFIIAYAFGVINKEMFLGLPLCVMIYSIIVVTLSLNMGKYFETPFKQIAGNIRALMIEDKTSTLRSDFSIEEFIFLQKFITDAFLYRKEQEIESLKLERECAQIEIQRTQAIQLALKEEKLKNEALHSKALEQDHFKKIAAQVAHDIASPVFALQMILPHCEVLPENLRSALSKFSIRIIDIAQNFLSQFKQRQEGGLPIDGVTRVSALIYSELIEIITEKKYEYTELPIRFISKINPNSYFTFANIEVDGFKRMISNIINNAVDAFEDGDGSITVHLDTVDDKVHLIIEDNGKGMPKDVVDKILNNIAVTSGKVDGHGIGFSQIRDTLNNNEGSFSIDSELGRGTRIILSFRKTQTPKWITDKIELNIDDLVVIVDDEPYIHEAWECQFKSVAPNILRRHFEQGEEAISFLNQLTDEEKKKVFLLTDYELLKQKLNGLDIIRQIKVGRSILVTSHHNDSEIRELASNLEVKILPKELAFAVTINLD